MSINPFKNFVQFFKLVLSDDQGVPSSSRVIGLTIFITLSVCIAAITWVFLRKIYYINDANVLKIMTEGIIKFAWIYLIMAATALSLYGINIWKHVANIRFGGLLAPSEEEVIKPPTPLPIPSPTPTGATGATGSPVPIPKAKAPLVGVRTDD